MTVTMDPRIATLTPERLADIVTAGGGEVVTTWDYTYTAEEGGDGYTGHHVMYLADGSGMEIGNVGFARTMGENGEFVFSLSDFWDERHPAMDPERTSWLVGENRVGFMRLLSAFVTTALF